MKRKPIFYALIVLGGFLFGFGMALSQLAKPEHILKLLQLEDLRIILAPVTAILTTGIIFKIGNQIENKSILTKDKLGRRETTLDKKVIIGAVIFGLGWGIAGVCPGISYASLGIGNTPILASIAGMFIGAYIQGKFRTYKD